jgi:hypothetical protein
MIIPGIKTVKDAFGGDYTYIDPSVMSKRKAWNYLLKNGWSRCENKAYLKLDNVYAHNNSLKNYLIIEGL